MPELSDRETIKEARHGGKEREESVEWENGGLRDKKERRIIRKKVKCKECKEM